MSSERPIETRFIGSDLRRMQSFVQKQAEGAIQPDVGYVEYMRGTVTPDWVEAGMDVVAQLQVRGIDAKDVDSVSISVTRRRKTKVESREYQVKLSDPERDTITFEPFVAEDKKEDVITAESPAESDPSSESLRASLQMIRDTVEFSRRIFPPDPSEEKPVVRTASPKPRDIRSESGDEDSGESKFNLDEALAKLSPHDRQHTAQLIADIITDSVSGAIYGLEGEQIVLTIADIIDITPYGAPVFLHQYPVKNRTDVLVYPVRRGNRTDAMHASKAARMLALQTLKPISSHRIILDTGQE